jgi:hypothetical protein
MDDQERKELVDRTGTQEYVLEASGALCTHFEGDDERWKAIRESEEHNAALAIGARLYTGVMENVFGPMAPLMLERTSENVYYMLRTAFLFGVMYADREARR